MGPSALLATVTCDDEGRIEQPEDQVTGSPRRAALPGGLLLAQVQRDTRPLEVALDAMLDASRP